MTQSTDNCTKPCPTGTDCPCGDRCEHPDVYTTFDILTMEQAFRCTDCNVKLEGYEPPE